MTYSEMLRTPEWRKKRLFILKRDKFSCKKCKSELSLHVHHKRYIKGKFPWEVPNSYLVTLCSVCHKKVHENKHISAFFQEKPKNAGISRKQKTINKLYNNMSKSDFELQKKYDNLKNKKK